MHTDEPSTEALARAAVSGEADRFGEAWARVAPAIQAWAALRVRPPLRQQVDPDDIVQEVACRSWRAFAGWDAEQGAFRGWVFGIANNVLREVLRRLASDRAGSAGPGLDTERWAQVPDTATHVTQAVRRDESLVKLLQHVEDLPDDDRRLLILRGLEGLPHDQLAELLGSTSDAVAKRWQRLCERLRGLPRWSELMVP